MQLGIWMECKVQEMWEEALYHLSKRRLFYCIRVVGQKEKVAVEAIIRECTPELGNIYRQTKEGNGQKWMMLDLEDSEEMYVDIFRIIDIRRGGKH